MCIIAQCSEVSSVTQLIESISSAGREGIAGSLLDLFKVNVGVWEISIDVYEFMFNLSFLVVAVDVCCLAVV